jgi:hypothetical protein
LAKPYLDSLANVKTIPEVPPMLASLFRPEVQPYLISWFQYDPAELISELNIPVLIVNGTRDIQVSEAEAELLFENARGGELHIIPEMNHLLKRAPVDRGQNIATYTNPDLEIH